MNFLHVQPGRGRHPHQPQVVLHHLSKPGLKTSHRIDLVVLDVRSMTPLCLENAFREIASLRAKHTLHHCILLCKVPTLPLITRCIRTGFRDVVHEPLEAADLRRVLKKTVADGHVPSHVARTFFTYVRGLLDLEKPVHCLPETNTSAATSARMAELARREKQLQQRGEQLNHIQTRLDIDRAALASREEKLREATRRMEREMSAQQLAAEPASPAPAPTQPPFSTGGTRSSAAPLPGTRNTTHAPFPYQAPGTTPPVSRGYTQPPFPTAVPAPAPAPLPAELQLMLAQLQERTQSLDIRERMLREMEQLIAAQASQAVKVDPPGKSA